MSSWIFQTCTLFLFLFTKEIHTITLPWGPSIISRAGRASPSASWLTDCCPQGVKSVVNPTESPEPTEYSVCTEECCAGLEENTVTMEDGTLYTYCIDEQPELNDVLKKEISQMSLEKLYRLMQLMVQDSAT